MRILKKVLAVLVALLLLAGVIYLGVLSGEDNRFVVWFGIASAIVAPIGFALFGFAISPSDRDLIQRLSKIPEIERLVQEAKTQEEKVRVLEAERARLTEIVRLESRRQSIRDRNESLERDAIRILQELDSLDQELKLLDVEIGESVANDEIRQLRERVKARQEGDVIFHIGSRVYRVDRDIIKAIPFGFGNILLAYFRLIERLSNSLRNKTHG